MRYSARGVCYLRTKRSKIRLLMLRRSIHWRWRTTTTENASWHASNPRRPQCKQTATNRATASPTKAQQHNPQPFVSYSPRASRQPRASTMRSNVPGPYCLQASHLHDPETVKTGWRTQERAEDRQAQRQPRRPCRLPGRQLFHGLNRCGRGPSGRDGRKAGGVDAVVILLNVMREVK